MPCGKASGRGVRSLVFRLPVDASDNFFSQPSWQSGQRLSKGTDQGFILFNRPCVPRLLFMKLTKTPFANEDKNSWTANTQRLSKWLLGPRTCKRNTTILRNCRMRTKVSWTCHYRLNRFVWFLARSIWRSKDIGQTLKKIRLCLCNISELTHLSKLCFTLHRTVMSLNYCLDICNFRSSKHFFKCL